MESVGVYIGTAPETVRASGETILAILSSAAEEKTKRSALDTLRSLAGSPQNCSISNCNIEMPRIVHEGSGEDRDVEGPEEDYEEHF